MSLPHVPEIFVGFRLRFCVLAILMETGWKSSRNSLQQKGLPHTPSPPTILALSRTPICRSSMRVRKTEARSLTSSRKSTRPSAVKGAFRRDKLHFQPVRGDLLLADLKGLLFLFLVLCVRALVLLRRYAQHPAQRQHQLTRLDRVVAGSAEAEFVSARRVNDDVRTGLQRQSGRVEIIAFAVFLETDRDDFFHTVPHRGNSPIL